MIPTQQSDISSTWLDQALKETLSQDNEITSVNVEEIGTGVGLVAGLFRCQLTYKNPDTDASESVIVKIRTSDPGTLEVAKMFQLYEKEVTFYRDFAKLLPIAVPEVHFSEFNPANHDFVIVLEDLKYLAAQSQLIGATEPQAKLAIRNAARMHARFWGRDREPPLKGHFSLVAPSFTLKIHVGFRNSVKKTLDVFGAQLSDSSKRLIKYFGENLAGWYYEMAKGPRTLTHGDYRVDNMFFGNLDEEEIKVIDWQTNGIGAGMIDIVYFMSGSVESEVRRSIEKDALREYHNITCEEGGATWSFEECWLDYRRSFIPAMTVPVIAAGELSYEDENAYELMLRGLKRFNNVIDDLDVEEFVIERQSWFSLAGIQNKLGNQLAKRVASKPKTQN